jgi:DNA-binding transcriptional MerR regulator
VNEDRLSIEELADAAGLTRRGIRYYVQLQLLPAPHGLGRGKHYDHKHLERLRQLRELQSAGHSLEEIRQILSGQSVAPQARRSPASPFLPAPPPALRAELWRRLRIMEGVELSFDAARFNPNVEDLLALRAAIAQTFKPELTDLTQEQGETHARDDDR